MPRTVRRRRPIPGEAPDSRRQDLLERLGQLEENGESLRPIAEQLATENHLLQQTLEQIQEQHEHVRSEIKALKGPEHYTAVVTDVTRNGDLQAEVAAPGISKNFVPVHPDVDPEHLRIGSRCLVVKQRDCLLRMLSGVPDWKDVGTFEGYLEDGRRILLSHQEHFASVRIADELAEQELEKGDMIGFDRDVAGLAYVKVPPLERKDLFFGEVPTDEFSSVAGLEPQVARIKRAIDFAFKHAEVARRYRLPTKRGILLIGPPGNGKTLIGRCVGSYVHALQPGTDCRFMLINGSADIYSEWFGKSEERVKERFAAVREAAEDGPVVFFIDEVDAIFRRRGDDRGSGAPDRVLNVFLAELDGVRKLHNVVVIGATNFASILDRAATRPGRLDLKVHIPPPNRKTGRSILLHYLDEDLPFAVQHNGNGRSDLVESLVSRMYSANGDYRELATVELAKGEKLAVTAKDLISGAMLKGIVHMAAEEAAVREVETGQVGITEDDLVLALDRELRDAAKLLAVDNVKSYVTRIPDQARPVGVQANNG